MASSAASNFMSIVTDDILLEIFVRLTDARTAIQYSSVCKRWYDLILRNPKFIKKFIHQHHNHRGQLIEYSPHRQYTLVFGRSHFLDNQDVYYYDSELSQQVFEESCALYETPSASYINFLSYPWLVKGICNDLLLLVWEKSRDFYVCNPITRKWLQLPSRPGDFFIAGTGLVCQPDSSDAADTTRYRFRVVMMSPLNDSAVMFCSETGEWIVSRVYFPGKKGLLYGRHSVVCNGVVYWLDGKDEFYGVAAFDPFKDVDVEGRCRFIALPVPFGDDGWQAKADSTCFGACQDNLRFSLWLKRDNGTFAVMIWELDGDTSWHLVHRLDLKRANINDMYVLAFHPNDGDVIFVLCNHHLCRYEIRENKFEQLGKWPDNLAHQSWGPDQAAAFPLVHPFWPSPVPALPSP